MRLKLISVGKMKAPALRDTVEDYLSRLRRSYEVEWTELRKEEGRQAVAELQKREGARVLEATRNGYLVLLDEHGKMVTSKELAAKLEAWLQQGVKEINFAIGGPYGHGEELRKKAQWVWSLSPLTFPHQLVPLLLAEQLYRAHTILKGEPYHNE